MLITISPFQKSYFHSASPIQGIHTNTCTNLILPKTNFVLNIFAVDNMGLCLLLFTLKVES